MATGLEKQTLVSMIVEPSKRAPIRTTQTNGESFTASGAGTTTTTVANGVLTHATNDGYVGLIMRCVGATNTQNIGIDVEILAFDAATDTLTHTALPAATALGDQFVLWLPPDPVVVEAVGGAATVDGSSASKDTDRTEADDYWIGDNLVVRIADNLNAGDHRAVTDFVNATGAFTHTAFGANLAVGDLLYLRRFPKWWGTPSVTWGYEDIPHESQRGNFSIDQTVKGGKTWSVDCALPLKASGTAAGNGVLATPNPELDRILGSVFTELAVTGEAITGGTTSVPEITDGTMAQFPVGSMVMDSAGRCAMVIDRVADGVNPDEIHVRPVLDRTPIAAETLYAMATYTQRVTGHLTATFDVWKGGVVNCRMYGGLPTVRLEGLGRNQVPRLLFGYRGNMWVQASYALPTSYLRPSFDTVRPFSAGESLAIIAAAQGTTNTRLIVENASIDFGFEIVQEDSYSLPDAVYGGRIVMGSPVITATLKLDTASPNNTWAELQRAAGGQTFTMLLQHGRRVGHTVAFCGYKCQWLSPVQAVADNLSKIDMTCRVLASDATDSSTGDRVPDWALGC